MRTKQAISTQQKIHLPFVRKKNSSLIYVFPRTTPADAFDSTILSPLRGWWTIQQAKIPSFNQRAGGFPPKKKKR